MAKFSTYFHGAELREEVEGIQLPDGQDTSVIGIVGISPVGRTDELVLLKGPEDGVKEFGDPAAWEAEKKAADLRIEAIKAEIKKVDADLKKQGLDDAAKAALQAKKTELTAEQTALGDRNKDIDAAVAAKVVTLPQNLDAIFTSTNTIVIALNLYSKDILAEAGDGAQKFLKAVQGNAGLRTGIYKFLDSRDQFDFVPKLIIAPEFSQDEAVRLGMLKVADEGRGVALVDIDNNKTVEEAVAEGRNLTLSRLYPCYPRVKPTKRPDTDIPYSSFVAGHIALTDIQEGYNRSPSNRVVKGIAGLSKPVSFSMTDPNSDANRLNEVGISTLIRYRGFRHWGSRTAGKVDPIEVENMFLSVRRTRDVLNEAVLRIAFEAIDRGIGLNFIEYVETTVNEFIRIEKQNSRLLGGECKALPKDNPASQLKKGTIIFTVDSGAVPPAEQIKVISIVTDKYLEALFNG